MVDTADWPMGSLEAGAELQGSIAGTDYSEGAMRKLIHKEAVIVATLFVLFPICLFI